MSFEAVKELIQANGQEIRWTRTSGQVDPSFHKPAVQALWIAEAAEFEGWDIKREHFVPGKVEIKLGYPLLPREKAGVVENLIVSPAMALEVMLSETEIKEKGILRSTSYESVTQEQEILKDKLKEAKRYLLCGVINPRAFYNLIDELKNLGFTGELWVMDKSARPLDTVAAYWKNDWKEKYPDIELHLLQADVTAMDVDSSAQSISQRVVVFEEEKIVVTTVPEGYFDWMQMDTLGAYISPREWTVHMPSLGQIVSKKGVVVVSDMEEYGEVPVNLKLTEKQDKTVFVRMAEWAAKELGWQIDPEDAAAIMGSAFSAKPDVLTKQVGEDYEYWYPHMLHKLPHLSAVLTAEKYWREEEPARLFRYMVLYG